MQIKRNISKISPRMDKGPNLFFQIKGQLSLFPYFRHPCRVQRRRRTRCTGLRKFHVHSITEQSISHLAGQSTEIELGIENDDQAVKQVTAVTMGRANRTKMKNQIFSKQMKDLMSLSSISNLYHRFLTSFPN